MLTSLPWGGIPLLQKRGEGPGFMSSEKDLLAAGGGRGWAQSGARQGRGGRAAVHPGYKPSPNLSDL